MNKRFFKFAVYLSSLFLFSFTLKHRDTGLDDIRFRMEEIFSYHVDSKDLTPLLVKRSLKIFLDKFDPDKLYLTQDEVDSVLDLDDESLQNVVKFYKKGQFPIYQKLLVLIQDAILRNQEIRESLKEELIRTKGIEASIAKKSYYASYAKTREDLIARNQISLQYSVKAQSRRFKKELQDPKIKEKLVRLWEKKRQHHENLYLKNDNTTLASLILKSLAQSLDAHTNFFSKEEAYEFRSLLTNQIYGVGVVLKETDEGVFIQNILKDGVAAQSGVIEVGDQLLEVNGKKVAALTFEEVLDEMKGDRGTPLELGVAPSESASIRRVLLHRQRIVLEEDRVSFSCEPHANGIIGKITIPSFYDNGGDVNVEKDLRFAFASLRSRGPLLGLILDFRENSGGFLNQAIKIASLFVAKGIIVISKYADDEIHYERQLDGRATFSGPIIALTSKASASAAEIVSQTLQDHGVAVIVGDERTYGKGSMQHQTITDETTDNYYIVTVGRYYTASGRSPQVEGVKADLVVPSKYAPYRIGERYLQHPLSPDHLDGNVMRSLDQFKKPPSLQERLNVVPHLKPLESKWRRQIKILQKNSASRLEKDPDFALFTGEKPPEINAKRPPNYGVEDLQMKESVNIIKDMLILSSPKTSLR